jgi:FRG domain-containing protein
MLLNSWDEIHAHARPGWVYRGQRSSEWDLSTSLERCCAREGIFGEERYRLEQELLRDFRRAYHNYSQHVPSVESVVEWLSLMQHHGAPTRLLDCTYSIYVAAYFALETAESDCAVWGIKAPWALLESVTIFEEAGKTEGTVLQAPTSEAHEAASRSLFLAPPFAKAVVPLSPFRQNERLDGFAQSLGVYHPSFRPVTW